MVVGLILDLFDSWSNLRPWHLTWENNFHLYNTNGYQSSFYLNALSVTSISSIFRVAIRAFFHNSYNINPCHFFHPLKNSWCATVLHATAGDIQNKKMAIFLTSHNGTFHIAYSICCGYKILISPKSVLNDPRQRK